jgi:glycosyltransferase involved in cell wall biosynthesis
VQKRPRLLMATVGSLIRTDSQLEVAIAGRTTPELETWRAGLPAGQRDRVRLLGNLDRPALARLLDESQVFYCPSAFESFGIAAGEALCAGCSVVAERSLSMTAFEWFVSANSGTLAESGDTVAHVRAIQTELDAWASGARIPAEIARHWEERLHATQVAAKILAKGLPKEASDGRF